MKAVFADTFYYIALLDANDSAHEAAVAATRNLKSTTVTTAWFYWNSPTPYPHHAIEEYSRDFSIGCE